jgi:hypothetical protein
LGLKPSQPSLSQPSLSQPLSLSTPLKRSPTNKRVSLLADVSFAARPNRVSPCWCCADNPDKGLENQVEATPVSMIIDRERFQEIGRFVQRLVSHDCREVTVEDALLLDLPWDTLQSIYNQFLTRQVKAELGSLFFGNPKLKGVLVKCIERHPLHRFVNMIVTSASSSSSCASSSSIVPSSSSSGCATEIADDYDDLVLLQQYPELGRLLLQCPYNLASHYLKFKHPLNAKMSIATFLANPTECISDPLVRQNLFFLIGQDRLNAPSIHLMKEHIGKEYEEMLERLLRKRFMEFETEDDSRKKGRQKTPDILFTIPMAVRIATHQHIGDDYCSDNYNNPFQHRLNQGPIPMMLTSSSCSLLNDPQCHAVSSGRSSRALSFEIHHQQEKHQQQLQSQLSTSEEIPLLHAVSSSSPPRPSYPADCGQQSTILQFPSTAPINATASHSTPYLVVNWIDSKALFADMEVFEENLVQFRTYTNRFGRGMVIYWHGFCEDILSHHSLKMNDDLLICDSFPEDWLFPTGEPADGRKPQFDNIALNIV